MKLRPFGPTGWMLSAIGLGAMPLSVRRTRPTEAEAIGVIHHAVELGVTLIDTADSYCIDDTEAGHNERLIGKAMSLLPASARQRVKIATKGGLIRPGGRWDRCGRPDHLRTVCEQSLANLRVESIDIYQYHAPDPAYPLSDSLGELFRLRDEGKIQHVAVSNFSARQLVEAASIGPIVSVQNQYSPICRRPEQDGTLAGSQRAGLAFLPWSPLTGMGGAKSFAAGQRPVQSIAAGHGVSVQQVALAWLLSKGPMVFPIPGASRRESIADSVKAADLVLNESELASLDACWS